MVFSQDKVQQRLVQRSSLILQFLRFGGGVTEAADVEQIVYIPARTRGLQGIRPGQSSTGSVGVQIADIPVPHGRGGVGGGSLQGFSPGQDLRASSSCSRAAEVAFDGVFRTFPGVKKVRGPPASAEITRLVIFHLAGVALQLVESGGLWPWHFAG